MRGIVIALLAVSAAMGQDQISGQALEKAKQLTVMINATVDGDTRPGAGVIFALANGRVHIATANHLIRRGISKASDIQVEFRWLPGEQFPAELPTYYDIALDLAVIVVPGIAKTGAGVHSFRPARHSATAHAGYPRRAGVVHWVSSWNCVRCSAAQFSQVEALLIKYRVPGLVPGGYSGGLLVDRDGMILGLIRQDQPPNGEPPALTWWWIN